MAAADVHRLNLRPGFESGIIVARDEQERRSILVLDDSSGACLEVQYQYHHQQQHQQQQHGQHHTIPTHPPNFPPPKSRSISLRCSQASVQSSKAPISYFRGMFQLCLERYEMLHNMTAEVHFWDERTRFRLQVLCVPWVVTQEEVEKLRGEAEGLTAASAARIGGVGGCDVDLNADGHVVARRRKEERERERERDRERRRVEREERDCLRIEKRHLAEGTPSTYESSTVVPTAASLFVNTLTNFCSHQHSRSHHHLHWLPVEDIAEVFSNGTFLDPGVLG
ncbi:OB-fold nucleic acid binding domain-containing protein [Histoplasma capsulatum H143]|uniref:OB-fold nucleic acid binding domain-containing protein n=1 Tax=Ajellomyces capsulatus (strain H143) TaxID=544712 RepID=C6HDT1_AJECH|nr:OB-fold nucleic acid binding domain-containing protein [Histoplasma capsulatum H143]